jgi:aryl-alcohol dehydrogenase-like predicted oxidoreductase
MTRLRRLGRTGLNVSELTLGTSVLTAPGRGLAEAAAAVALALDRGINAVEVDAGDTDTLGLVGSVLGAEGARDRVHVFARLTSLVLFDLPSPHVPAQQAYPGWHIRAQTDSLLQRLGVERLGLQQLHAWCPEWLHEGDWLETLGRLREEGKIAGFGVSLFDHDVDAGLEVVASGNVDAVQVMYNVFDQGAAAALLPLCHTHDVGVIARSPLYYGALASPSAARAQNLQRGDWRTDYFFAEHLRETQERVQKLAREVEPPERSVSDLALRFSLSHPAISTVAVGMHRRAHIEANLQALLPGPLSSARGASLARHKWLC